MHAKFLKIIYHLVNMIYVVGILQWKNLHFLFVFLLEVNQKIIGEACAGPAAGGHIALRLWLFHH
jgi:hypothetical protein